MAKLIVNPPGVPAMHLDLPPGIHQMGRSPDAHFQIDHPSVSGRHCQIAVEPAGATITDLGSTNGTWVEGRRIQQEPLRPGQRLRLGEVEAVFEPQAAPAGGLHLASTPSESAVPASARLMAAPPLRPRLEADQPVAMPTGNFYQNIPDAFAYPLKHFGIVALAVGSVLFLSFNLLPGLIRMANALFFSDDYGRGFGLFVHAAFAGTFFGIGTIFNVLVTGYIFLFMQTVVSSSANGENRMPMYPPFESWWDDAVGPYFRLLGILICCLAPAVLCRSYLGPDFKLLTQVLGFLGFCYFSMALLAVSVCDSLSAVDPRVVIPSICRIPAEYAVYCLLLALLLGASFVVGRCILEYTMIVPSNPFARDSTLIYRLIAVEFVFLYFMVVAMRLLGLLYLTGRERLAWRG